MIDSKRNKKLFETLLFLAKLLVLSAPLYAVLNWGNLVPLQNFVAEEIANFFKFVGFQAYREGTTLFVGKVAFSVTADCTGWKSLIFMSALVVATGSGLAEKLEALSLNLPILYSINLSRVALVVFFTYSYGPGAYELMHDFMWKISTVASVLLLWFMWTRRKSLIIEQN